MNESRFKLYEITPEDLEKIAEWRATVSQTEDGRRLLADINRFCSRIAEIREEKRKLRKS